MKKSFAIIASLVLFITLVALHLRAPLATGYLGNVSVTVKNITTNASGGLTAAVAVKNEGPHTVSVGIGTQVRRANEWVDAMSGLANAYNFKMTDPAFVAPGEERVTIVDVPAGAKNWRSYALCQKEYKQHWSTPLRFFIDGYLLKRGIVEHFYSDEQTR